MSDNLLLGIDAGTSRIKCVLYSFEGLMVAAAEEKTDVLDYSDGKKEQDMELLWKSIAAALRRLIYEEGVEPERIKAVGVTGQGEGCWLVDENAVPVGNAVLWCDGRAGNMLEKMTADPSFLSTYREITGSYPFSGAQLIILKWLMENEPDRIEKAKHVLFCKDWIRLKLTDEAAVEYSDASTSLLDLHSKKVSDSLFKSLSIESCQRLVPPLLASAQIAGNITEKAAEETGLASGTPVIAGLIDIAATALGAGAVKANDCCTILGTTACNLVVASQFDPEMNPVAGHEIDASNEKYLKVTATMAGTPNIDWFLDSFMGELRTSMGGDERELFEYLEGKVEDIGIGSGGVIYHPYISPAGERAPFVDSNAKAQFFGISDSTTRLHLLRAVYEGVAFSIRDNLKHESAVQHIYLTGGGAKSRVWAEIIANVTGKTLYLVDESSPAAKGSAFAAGLGIGAFSGYEEIVRKTRERAVCIEPNMQKHRIYSDMFELYIELRERSSQLWKQRNEILKRIGERK